MKKKKTIFSALLGWTLLLVVWMGKAAWADEDISVFVDPTFNCPALITCRQVCVATLDDCPASMRCSEGTRTGLNNNLTLCADGSCAEICDPSLVSPCLNSCAAVACQRVVDTDEQCQAQYQPYYDEEDTCAAAGPTAPPTNSLTFTEPAFIAAYCWIGGLALLMIMWCAYNQRISPVAASCRPLEVEMTWRSQRGWASGNNRMKLSEVSWFQTGYKRHPVGLCLYMLTLGTMAGFVAALIWLIVQYYSWRLYRRQAIIESDEDAAKVFVMTWSAALAWFLAMKWPSSMESLFLRRCPLNEATFAALYNNRNKEQPGSYYAKTTHLKGLMRKLQYLFEGVGYCFHAVMSFAFSDVTGMNNFWRGHTGDFQLVRVKHDDLGDGTCYFMLHFRRYNLNRDRQVFVPGVWKVGETIGEIAIAGGSRMGLSDQEVMDRRRTVGPNVIYAKRPSLIAILYQEVCKPFFVFQFFIVMRMFPYYYYYMGATYAVVVLCGLFVVSWLHYRSMKGRYRLMQSSGQIEVLRDGQFISLSHEELVPGDIVQLQPGLVYSDMVLLSSSALLMDESALTGESTPQTKDPITQTPPSCWISRSSNTEECPASSEGTAHKIDLLINPSSTALQFDRVLHRAHSVSAGTLVLETDQSIAIVTATGSHTAKGELLREMFSFQRHSTKFDKEIGIVIGILVLFIFSSFTVLVHLLTLPPVYKWFLVLSLFTASISPLLPTALLLSVAISENRLAKKRITCLDSQSILIAGKVTHAFFDKTGTLTKQGLDFLSARSAATWNMKASISIELGKAMACCHSMTRTKEGALVGNPIDTAMFTASRATLHHASGKVVVMLEQGGSNYRYELVRHFGFDHQRMTQTVIVRCPGEFLTVLVKGSAESIRINCNNELPPDFDQQLRDNAKAGHYQISVACKKLDATVDVDMLTRDEVESNLDFVGVLNFTNAMREESPDVIRQLLDGDIRPAVVTGDNVMAGIRIAQESGIMTSRKPVYIGSVGHFGEVTWSDEAGQSVGFPSLEVLGDGSVELAVHGNAWQELVRSHPDDASRLASHIRVFGRCTPHDKVAVIDAFVNAGYITLMCGDGGNDCGALKAAHVGVALSIAEASVVSPFSSLDKSITSVVEVLRMGRCALPSTFATYKYLMVYGQMNTTVTLVSAFLHVFLSEWSWVMMDGIWTITLAFSLPLARPTEKLSNTRPTSSLLSSTTLSSCLGIMAMNLLFVGVALATLWHQDWFQCRKWTATDGSNYLYSSYDNYEAEVLFLVIGFQYLSTAMAFNFGYEFRQGWHRNYVFVAFVAVYSFIMIYITLVPGKLSCFLRVQCTNDNLSVGVTVHYPMPVQNRFNTTVMPMDFRVKLVLIMLSNALANCGYEYFVVNGIRQYVAARKHRQRAQLAVNLPSSGVLVVDCSDLPSPAVVNSLPDAPTLVRSFARSSQSSKRSLKVSSIEDEVEIEENAKHLVNKILTAEHEKNKSFVSV